MGSGTGEGRLLAIIPTDEDTEFVEEKEIYVPIKKVQE